MGMGGIAIAGMGIAGIRMGIFLCLAGTAAISVGMQGFFTQTVGSMGVCCMLFCNRYILPISIPIYIDFIPISANLKVIPIIIPAITGPYNFTA